MQIQSSITGLYSAATDTGFSTAAPVLEGLSAIGRDKHSTTEQIDKKANEFEALFLGLMLEHMAGESLGTDVFGDKETSEIYKSMLMREYGQIVADAGGIGIAGNIRTELLRLQEVGA